MLSLVQWRNSQPTFSYQTVTVNISYHINGCWNNTCMYMGLQCAKDGLMIVKAVRRLQNSAIQGAICSEIWDSYSSAYEGSILLQSDIMHWLSIFWHFEGSHLQSLVAKKNSHMERCVLYRCGWRTDWKGRGPMGAEVMCTATQCMSCPLPLVCHTILSPSTPTNAVYHFAQLFPLEHETLKMKTLWSLQMSGNTWSAPQKHTAEVLKVQVLYATYYISPAVNNRY
jgi:hypothetical protein